MEYATVIGGTLNIRSDTDVKSSRIAQIPNNTVIAVLEKGTVWCKIVYNAYEGYVMTKFLKFESDSDDEQVTITLSRLTAQEILNALQLSLNK